MPPDEIDIREGGVPRPQPPRLMLQLKLDKQWSVLDFASEVQALDTLYRLHNITHGLQRPQHNIEISREQSVAAILRAPLSLDNAFHVVRISYASPGSFTAKGLPGVVQAVFNSLERILTMVRDWPHHQALNTIKRQREFIKLMSEFDEYLDGLGFSQKQRKVAHHEYAKSLSIHAALAAAGKITSTQLEIPRGNDSLPPMRN